MEFNLADLWEIVVDTVPDHEAIVDGDRRFTFAEVEARANRLAHALTARGIGRGDHVALYLYNSVEYLEAMVATFKIRAVPINVNYRYVEYELQYLLDDADAKAVIFHTEFADKLTAITGALPKLRTFLGVASDAIPDTVNALACDGYDDALAHASAARDFAPRSADDLYVLYTGGTTGMPKGVMWRHEDAFFGAMGGGLGSGAAITSPGEIAERCRASRVRCVPACPFMHGTAHWMAFSTLLTGGSVIVSPDRPFDPVSLWHLIARERANFLVIVGDAFARPLVEAIPATRGADLSCLRVVLSGGAILSPSVKLALVEQLAGAIIVDGFGASETGGQGQSISAAGGSVANAPRFSVGADTTVLDADLRQAAPGVAGLLARRGHIPLGYYNDAKKSAETFPVVDGVRWSVPGDHAVLETDGTITVLGRGSVSINTGGEKVYPEEVEAALKGHPAVFDAVVVGVPDERYGERVVAVIQMRDGCCATATELQAHVRTLIAGYKVPRAFIVADAVERSPSGKPDYRWARAQVAAT